MFAITNHKGFHMTFANGYTISVQWGPGNYANPRDFNKHFNTPMNSYKYSKESAEIALFDKDFNFKKLKISGDYVAGYLTPDQVAEIIHLAATNPTELIEGEL